MILTSEVFVMVVFIIGFPFFLIAFKDAKIPQYRLFILAYTFLTLSNIFTVVEGFCCEFFFNLCEHLCITLSALTLLIAIFRCTHAGTVDAPEGIRQDPIG